MLRVWKNICKEFRQLCVGGSANTETVHISNGSIQLSSNQDVNSSCIKLYQQTTNGTLLCEPGKSTEHKHKSAESNSYYYINHKWNLSKSIFLEICGLSSAVALGWNLSQLRQKQSHLYDFSSSLAKVITDIALPQLRSGIRLTINDLSSSSSRAFSNVLCNTTTNQDSSTYVNTTTAFALSLTEEINQTLEEMVKSLETSSALGLADWQNSVGIQLINSARKKELSEYDYLIDRLESDRFSAYQREALNCFRESKKLGSIKGAYNLGLCYEQGIGTIIDKEKAVAHYEEAARNNHPAAQYNLGLLLYRRYLTDESSKENDITRAYDLLRQAAQQGVEEASAALIAIASEQENQDATTPSTTTKTTVGRNTLCNGMASFRKASSEPHSFTSCHRQLKDSVDTTEFELRRDSISFYLGD
ncbi:uncharacterized protein LOC130688429 [Daphnia carinata]|uniref:uncharacterized protein LOC130688429 n=1 Tax=Daphnia carinata TaxID=120202 RepID=UPI00257A4381|nr:uncharacterized protein LOC130688429 [Daphnia carinata]